MSDGGSGRHCCIPAPGAAARDVTTRVPAVPPAAALADGTVRSPGGEFLMGADAWAVSGDGEGPVRAVWFAAFRVGRCAVSNAELRIFTDATGHLTGAERFGWSFVFAGAAGAPRGGAPGGACPPPPGGAGWGGGGG
ncbi:SUMF1/EgtB/PvdO family nonheme iron enzyme, partial [Streptomyces sp. NPDC058682]|uniref:SUMF1/EgtB/PvdO family nonheme iron enzyme n=1 Tax=Streptomyces sp. NPDC058682 TaxID=3346596 RepID=UPI0036469B2F